MNPLPNADTLHHHARRMGGRDSNHTAAMVALAVIAALTGVDMAVCLVILMLAPAVTVVGYEMHGYRHQADVLAKEDSLNRY